MSTDNNEYPKVLYSILDYPERLAEIGLTHDEAEKLIEEYTNLDTADFKFVGNRRD